MIECFLDDNSRIRDFSNELKTLLEKYGFHKDDFLVKEHTTSLDDPKICLIGCSTDGKTIFFQGHSPLWRGLLQKNNLLC